MLDKALGTATSGIQANAYKIANNANNIVNAQSTSSSQGAGVYQPVDTYTVAQPSGGTQAFTTPRDPATVQSLTPAGLVAEFPNVNLDQELISVAQAANQYKANAQVISTVKDLAETLNKALDS